MVAGKAKSLASKRELLGSLPNRLFDKFLFRRWRPLFRERTLHELLALLAFYFVGSRRPQWGGDSQKQGSIKPSVQAGAAVKVDIVTRRDKDRRGTLKLLQIMPSDFARLILTCFVPRPYRRSHPNNIKQEKRTRVESLFSRPFGYSTDLGSSNALSEVFSHLALFVF